MAGNISHNEYSPGVFTTIGLIFKPNRNYETIEFYPWEELGPGPYPGMLIDNIIMREFKVDAGADLYTSSCADAIQISVDCPIPGATYSWSPLSGIVGSSNVPNPLVKPHVTTKYTVTITYDDRGTIHTATDNVNVFVEDCCNNISQTIPSNYTVSDLLSDPAFSSYISGNTLNAPFSIKMAGDFYVDQDFTINDAHLVMEAGAEITIQNGNKLTLNNSILEVCGNTMWKGIKVTGTSSEVVLNNTEIWEAKKGINSINGGVFTVSNSLFDGNYYGIYVDTYNGYHSGTVKGSTFLVSSSTLAPYYGLGAKAGIYVNDVGTITGGGGITIGDATSVNNRNVFIGNPANSVNFSLFNGVYVYHSSVKIINNEFKNFNPVIISVGPVKAGIYIEGPTTVGPNPNYDVPTAIIGGGIMNNEKNYFLNNSRGVVIQNYTGAIIRSNEFHFREIAGYLSTAISIGNNSAHIAPIDIAFNKIYKCNTGILLSNIFGPRIINIERNEVYLNHTIYSTGIALYDTKEFLTLDNYIHTATNGIVVNGGYGTIKSNDIVDLSVYNIYMPPYTPVFLPFNNYGIRVSNPDGLVKVEDNNISASSPTSNTDVFGISYEMAADPIILCNTMENVGTGVHFAGVTTLSGSGIMGNVMHNNHNGMVLTNGSILNDIGSTTIPSDNKWTGTFSGYHTYTDGANGNNTTLWTRSGGLPYVPQSNGNEPGYLPLVPNSTATGTVFACGDGGTEPEQPGFEFSSIENNGERSETEQWLLEYQVYRMLLNDSIIDDPLAENFKDSMDNTALGQALALMDSINQIVPGSEVQPLSAEGVNTMENSMVAVANIMLELRVNDQDTLLSNQQEILDSLAVSCPFLEGPAVYHARGILFNFTRRNYINECETYSAGDAGFMRLKDPIAGSDILVYPNPSREDVNVSIQLEDKNTAQLILFDYTGKMISDHKLLNGVNQINVSRLKSSIYFYKIIVNGKIKKSDKLIVL